VRSVWLRQVPPHEGPQVKKEERPRLDRPSGRPANGNLRATPPTTGSGRRCREGARPGRGAITRATTHAATWRSRWGAAFSASRIVPDKPSTSAATARAVNADSSRRSATWILVRSQAQPHRTLATTLPVSPDEEPRTPHRTAWHLQSARLKMYGVTANPRCRGSEHSEVAPQAVTSRCSRPRK